MDIIWCTYEVDIGKVDITLLKPSVPLFKGGRTRYYDDHNSLWGYLPGWLLEPTYATSCIRGKIFDSFHTLIFHVRDSSDNTILYILLMLIKNLYIVYFQ